MRESLSPEKEAMKASHPQMVQPTAIQTLGLALTATSSLLKEKKPPKTVRIFNSLCEESGSGMLSDRLEDSFPHTTLIGISLPFLLSARHGSETVQKAGDERENMADKVPAFMESEF